MKKLIINADDFGLHPLINKGIIEGHQKGMITSTSIMPSAPCFKEAANLAVQNPELGIGIHLTLVGGVAPVFFAYFAGSFCRRLYSFCKKMVYW